VCNAEKSRGKDKDLDLSKQMKDKAKRPTDKSNVDQQKQKNSDGRYVCLNVLLLFCHHRCTVKLALYCSASEGLSEHVVLNVIDSKHLSRLEL